MTPEDHKIKDFYNSLPSELKEKYLEIHSIVILDEISSDGYVTMTLEISNKLEEKLNSIKRPDETLEELIVRAITESATMLESQQDSLEQRVEHLEDRVQDLIFRFSDDGK
jgi:polyhydroxyalkanoate synthesis regulator phasin